MPLIYRADIDGLRSLAVLSVLGYHFFPTLVPGGFIGVDVFFVISGYMITRILVDAHHAAGMHIGHFYARRIRRIFPALLLVLLFCFFAGWYLLLANEYKQLGKHIFGGASFTDNFFLWLEAGYFDSASDAKPLLHLWSLGIEEQFYIVWPLLLWLLLKTWREPRKAVLGLGLLSLAASCFWVYHDRTQAFYSPLSRAWELLAGAVLALPGGAADRSESDKRWPWLPGAAAGLIVIGGLTLSSQWPFPGLLALLPVGAACVLVQTPPSHPFNTRVLGHPWMVAVGRISYPLYLWHWPLISLATIMESGRPELGVRLGLVLASFVLAAATFLCVEKPARHLRDRYLVPLLVTLMLITGFLGVNVYQRDGLDRIRYKQLIVLSDATRQDFTEWADTGLITVKQCKMPFLFPETSYCLTNQPLRPPTVALIGDSHAFHAYWGLAESFRQRGDNLIALGRGACVPLLGYRSGPECQPHIDNMLRYVSSDARIHAVTLVFRGRYLPNQSDASAVQEFQTALEQTLKTLLQAGKTIYYFAPVVEPGFDPRLCLGHLPLGRKSPYSCDLSRAQSEQQSALLMDSTRRVLQKYPAVHLVDPNDFLCQAGRCPVLRDGHAMFTDENHLSYSGSLLVGRGFAQYLQEY